MRKLLFIGLSLLVLVGCATAKNNDDKPGEKKPVVNQPKVFTPDPKFTMKATITTSEGVIVADLYQDLAPEAANNFATLANSGFYDNLTFHRAVENFMIQGGDPQGNGTGGPGYSIKGEFATNGVPNQLKHTKGVLSMARSAHEDSAGSQFFIMHEKNAGLDGSYAAFGLVTEGLEVVDAIAKAPANGETPVNKVVIESITVDTNGLDISDFTKIKK